MNGVGPYGARHTLKKSYSAQKNMWAHTELATKLNDYIGKRNA